MQNNWSSTDQQDVARALERVITWLRHARQTTDLSASGLSALSRLATMGPLRVTQLAQIEGLTQPGMTTLLHRLESAGFATRGTDPEDGRAVLVSITDVGRDRYEAHLEEREAIIARRLDDLTPAEQRALVAALPALTRFVQP